MDIDNHLQLIARSILAETLSTHKLIYTLSILSQIENGDSLRFRNFRMWYEEYVKWYEVGSVAEYGVWNLGTPEMLLARSI